jgi:hypothetical protein
VYTRVDAEEAEKENISMMTSGSAVDLWAYRTFDKHSTDFRQYIFNIQCMNIFLAERLITAG